MKAHQGHLTIIFGEICVQQSQAVLRISVLCCQTAIDSFTKTSRKRFATMGKVVPYAFGRDFFVIFGTEKGHLAVSDEQMVGWQVLRR